MIDTSDQELAALYALDLLEISRREEFEQVLRARPDLRRLARDLQEVSDALALDCPRQRPPEGTWELIHRQVQWDQERKRSNQQLRRKTLWTWAGWAAAACLAAAWCLSAVLRTTESARSFIPTGTEGSNDFAGPRPSPALTEARPGTSGHDASSLSNKAAAPPAATGGTNALQAQLNAARAREREWSQALTSTLSQITNLAAQLEMLGTSPPGTRRVSWVAMAPPGQANLADQALDAILSRLPSVLTNIVNTSPDTAGYSNGLRFEPRVNSPPNSRLAQDNQTTARSDKETEANSPKPIPGRGNPALGVVIWDGRSPTMTVALSDIPEPPEGHQWEVSSVDATGQSHIMGKLQGNLGVLQFNVNVPASGWSNGLPNLTISVPGQVLIVTP